MSTPGAGLVIRVVGEPAPQGSLRHVGGGRLIDSNAKTRPWRGEVVLAAQLARIENDDLSTPGPAFLGPVSVEVAFTLPRPGNHYRSGRLARLLREAAPAVPTVKPDIDKLTRAVLDALTLAAVWRDDAQVAELVVRKCYVGLGLDALDTPGAVIRVHPMKATIADLAGNLAESVVKRMASAR